MGKKKVITVTGDSSKWYEKVIFVVDKDKSYPKRHVDLLLEAEKIVSDYMLRGDMEYTTKSKAEYVHTIKSPHVDRAIDTFLFFSILACVLAIIFLLLTTYM